jgi:hypothetical protein
VYGQKPDWEIMALEKFTPTGGRAGSNEPLISMRKSAGIGINQKALNEYFEDTEAVELYYDEETNEVGLKPIEEKSESTHYTLTRGEGGGGSVTPKAFIHQYNLVPATDNGEPVTKRFEPYWDDDSEIILIDMDESVGQYGTPGTEDPEN